MTKRTRISVLALMLCIAMCLSLGACSSGSPAEGGQTPSDSNSGSSSKITKFIDSVQDQLDSIRDTMGDMLDIDITARGNSLVYSFKYNIDTSSADKDSMAAALESALDSMSSTFTSILSALQKEVPEAESVIVEYLDNTGNVIVSKEFK